MYHPPSKRKQLMQRILVYGFMSAATLGLVAVLVSVMLGYQFNRSDGRIEQGGLVQFDSRPTGGNVTIDGTSFGSQTPSKTTMTSGQHFITIERSGYKKWQKSVAVVPGSVLWLNYAHLIPNDLKPVDVATLKGIGTSIASPDDKWMAISEDPASANIRLADVSGETVKTSSIDIPTDKYTHPSADKVQSFTIEKWDPESRYVLVKHLYDDAKTEWVIVDTQNASQTKNLTTLLSVDASKVMFSNGNSQVLYAQIGSDVRKIDLGAATISRPLVTNVADFSLYDRSLITYATLLDPATKTRSIGYYQDGADKPQVVRTYTDDGAAPLHFVVSKYFGDTYMAIAYGGIISVIKGDLPTEKTTSASALRVTATMTMPDGANVQYLSILTNGRFVVAQTGATYDVYDVELQKPTSTILKGTSEFTKEIGWLDSYTLWGDRDNMLRMYEFDGANQHDIMPVVSGQGVALSPNAKYLYGISKSADGQFHLSRVKLIL
jgi:hypothetical protein